MNRPENYEKKKRIVADWLENDCGAYDLLNYYDLNCMVQYTFTELVDWFGADAYNKLNDLGAYGIDDSDSWYIIGDDVVDNFDDVLQSNMDEICECIIDDFDNGGIIENEELHRLLTESEDYVGRLVEYVRNDTEQYIYDIERDKGDNPNDSEILDCAYKTVWAWEILAHIEKTRFFGMPIEVCKELYDEISSYDKHVVKKMCESALINKPIHIPIVTWVKTYGIERWCK